MADRKHDWFVPRRHDGAAQVSRQLTLTERELFHRLGWFTHIRWCIGVLCLLMLLVSWYVLGVRFSEGGRPESVASAVEVVLGMFLYNAVFTFLVHVIRARGRINRRVIVWMALAQIACDLLAVCALVHYTGGVENFFIILMLLPLVISAELLPRPLAYGTAGVAAVLTNALAWGEQRGLIPHVSVEWGPGRGPSAARLYADPLYVLEVTAALTIALFATVFIASTIAARLRSREEELEAAYDRLRQADEAKTFFMRKASHELRAPLSAVANMLGAILLTVGQLNEEHRRLIGRARHRTEGLMNLVADLRRYSRLQPGQAVVEFRPVRLDEVVRTVADLLRPQAAAAGLALACTAEQVEVAGDEELLRELVTNLVANAIQYTPAGGRVEVGLRRDNASAVLTVSDTGIGLGEQSGARLFEEFYRAPQARHVFPEGTGLGLAICKRIVEMHGGRISADARPEGGSVFVAELPLSGPGPLVKERAHGHGAVG